MLTPVFEPPRIMLTPFWSAHSRNLDAPMSGLFWWSVLMNSIVLPSTLAAEVGDRHLGRGDAAVADDVGIQARHVVDVADDDLVGRGCAAPAPRVAPKAIDDGEGESLEFHRSLLGWEKGRSHAEEVVQHRPCWQPARSERTAGRRGRAPSRRSDPPAARQSGSSVRPSRSCSRSRAACGSSSPAPARSPAPGLRRSRRAAAAWRRCAGCGRPRASAARRPTGACPGWRARSRRLGNIA